MEYSRQSDHELLMMMKSGNIQGFNVLFSRHWTSLFQIARKILDDDDLAKDTLQEAFVSFYEKARHKEINHVKAYLLKSVKYQCFMQLRSGKISAKHLHRLETVAAVNYVDEYMDAAELQTLLQQEMQLLPEKCREVFYLSRYKELSNKEIAQKMNLSQRTVEWHISSALQHLRQSVKRFATVAILVIFPFL